MKEISAIAQNNVSADGQVYDCFVKIFGQSGGKRVLFLGNSITWHLPKPEIGWYRECGMAASGKDSDYLHLTVKALEKKYGAVQCCVAQLGRWEKRYWQSDLLNSYSQARDFNADLIICRLGENIWGSREMLKTEPLYTAFDNMIKFFKTNGDARVIVTNLFWEWQDIDSEILRVAQDNAYVFVDIRDLGRDDNNKALNQFEHSGVAIHPSDEGMKQIAARIIEKV